MAACIPTRVLEDFNPGRFTSVLPWFDIRLSWSGPVACQKHAVSQHQYQCQAQLGITQLAGLPFRNPGKAWMDYLHYVVLTILEPDHANPFSLAFSSPQNQTLVMGLCCGVKLSRAAEYAVLVPGSKVPLTLQPIKLCVTDNFGTSTHSIWQTAMRKQD